jgi:multidrug resistance efflux pump
MSRTSWIVALVLGLVVIHGPAGERTNSVRGREARQAQAALELKGYVVPVATVTVSPQVSGQVIELVIEEGKRVEKGALLARLDPMPYEFDCRRAEARVEGARARLAQAQRSGHEDVTAEAKARLAEAEAERDKAKYRLERTQIRAPISGTILAKKTEAGNCVNPAAVGVSPIICEMADLMKLEVDLTIQERDLHLVSKGQKCEIRLEAFPDTRYRGHVSRIMPIADRAKGAIPIRVRIDIPKGDTKLRPEMGAIVSFPDAQ